VNELPLSALAAIRLVTLLSVATLPWIGFASPTSAASEVVVGTGSVYGVYFQVGRAICKLVNRESQNLNCSAVPTAGSRFNTDSVRDNAFELGIVQSDVQFKAFRRTGDHMEYVHLGYENLRSLFSVHGEPFTLVARRDSGIRVLSDLEGRRVNLGNPGSGQRATMGVVMETMGWTEKSFAFVGDLPASQQSSALCDGQIEAMVYVVGHPNKSIAAATEKCGAVIVNVEGPAIDRLVAENPYYSYMSIPGGMYQGNIRPILTFGVRATVVVSEDLEEETAYAVTKAVFDNIEEFKNMYPTFGSLDTKSMIGEGLTAPLHEGARRYFKEKGLM